MKISIRDPRLTDEERAAKQEARAERKKLRAAANALRKASFDALGDAQKLDALRNGLQTLLRVEIGR